MCGKKSCEVVHLSPCSFNVGIVTTFACGCGVDIPQGDSVLAKQFSSFVRNIRAGADKLAHDLPESIVLLGIVLAFLERKRSGQCTQDDHTRIGSRNCGEALMHSLKILSRIDAITRLLLTPN